MNKVKVITTVEMVFLIGSSLLAGFLLGVRLADQIEVSDFVNRYGILIVFVMIVFGETILFALKRKFIFISKRNEK